MENKTIINDELRFLSKYGFSKNTMDNLSNNALLNLNFSKGLNTVTGGFKTTFKSTAGGSKQGKGEKVVESYWQKKEQDKINLVKLEQENTKKDVDYVKTLHSWDSKFLPKIK
jgi:hypothetical protein